MSPGSHSPHSERSKQAGPIPPLGEDTYSEVVGPEIADHVTPLFEWICQRALPRLLDRQFTDVGRWWFKEQELDVPGLSREDSWLARASSRPIP
ncbi:DUF234 domain-containing protein [Halorhabdus rudnickae]|uniref:DUF234 domain-containing protein n=1 Tax=Halorhabdus rudnickae TaxID=1775544 RepID=UPI001FCEFB97|nr:DUF234 domain-containing protein [Halorhabdus rudnickae]